MGSEVQKCLTTTCRSYHNLPWLGQYATYLGGSSKCTYIGTSFQVTSSISASTCSGAYSCQLPAVNSQPFCANAQHMFLTHHHTHHTHHTHHIVTNHPHPSAEAARPILHHPALDLHLAHELKTTRRRSLTCPVWPGPSLDTQQHIALSARRSSTIAPKRSTAVRFAAHHTPVQ